MFSSKKSLSAFALVMLSSASAQANMIGESQRGIVWDSENEAVAVGTACRSEGAGANVFFERFGEDFAVILGYVGINLSGARNPLAERHTCSLRIPFTVKPGFYVSGLDLSIPFVVSKDAESSGEVAGRVAFMGNQGVVDKVSLPYGRAVSGAISTLEFKADYSAGAMRFCRGISETSGILAINLATAGQRDTHSDRLFAAFPDDQFLYLSEALTTRPCSLR